MVRSAESRVAIGLLADFALEPRSFPGVCRLANALARALKAKNSYGIAYDSVRHAGGECVAVFRPPALSNRIQGPHFGYVWDGEQITTVYEKKLYANY